MLNLDFSTLAEQNSYKPIRNIYKSLSAATILERTGYEGVLHQLSCSISNMEGGDAFEMGGMDVMEVGDMEMMDGGDMEMMEGGDMEMMKEGDMVVMEAEDCGGDGHRLRFKGGRPRQNYQVPQKRRPRVKVKDYMCFSIISIMCFNVMFLGLLALRMSMRLLWVPTPLHDKGATEETLKRFSRQLSDPVHGAATKAESRPSTGETQSFSELQSNVMS
ncbi:hypothetical protein NFI96_032390, partial [Prochilodus magdalenae]